MRKALYVPPEIWWIGKVTMLGFLLELMAVPPTTWWVGKGKVWECRSATCSKVDWKEVLEKGRED